MGPTFRLEIYGVLMKLGGSGPKVIKSLMQGNPHPVLRDVDLNGK